MKLLIVASLISISAAASLDRAYLPALMNSPLIQPGSGPAPRPQSGQEAAAQILKQDSDVTATGFQYSFETQNGISAQARGEEQGGALRSQGGYSYKGTDGQTYTVTYTADENGYQPQGAHLPTSPPIPEEILKSLEQNARDEAAGITNEGSYSASQYGENQGQGGSVQSFQPSSNQFRPSIGNQQSFSPQTGYRY